MKIKSKILFSNILMILIPVAVIIIMFFVVFGAADFRTWDPLDIVLKTETFESLVNEYLARVDSGDPELLEVEDVILDLKNRLDFNGYEINVYEDGELIYAEIDEDESQKILEDYGIDISVAESISVISDDAFLIKGNYSIDMGDFLVVVAGDSHRVQLTGYSYFVDKYIVPISIGFIIIVILVIIFTDTFITSYITGSIFIPLDRLKEATNRISQGDLEHSIFYNSDNEIKPLFNDFERMREKLVDTQKENQRLMKYRETVIRGISHDLRTPLTCIKGYTQGLIDGVASNEDMRKRYLEAIMVRSDELEKLIDNLSFYLTILQDKSTFNFEVVRIRDFISNYVKDYEMSGQDMLLHLYNLRDDTRLRVDTLALKRILDNIIGNSIKYAGVKKLVVTIRVYKNRSHVFLSIKDNGKGVSRKNLENIFDPFFMVDEARSRSKSSSGLGLSIVKRIVSEHGGSVYARSSVGFEIIIQLPIFGGGDI